MATLDGVPATATVRALRATITSAPQSKPWATASPSPTASAKEDITLTILYDNNPHDERLRTAWGFACLVQRGDLTLLFDTGGDAPTLLSNMATLGLDPADIDLVALSHVHGDHVGGLDGLLALNKELSVYLPSSFPDEFRERVKARARVVDVRAPMEIAEGIYTTGEMGDSIREQALALRTAQGLVVLTGCAHPGIDRIVERAKEITGSEIYLVMGGFHLSGTSSQRIGEIIAAFRQWGVKQVAPCHCSGDLARRLFREAYGEACVLAGVGQVLKIKK